MLASMKSVRLDLGARALARVLVIINLLGQSEAKTRNLSDYYLNYDQPTRCGSALHKVKSASYITGGESVSYGEFPSLVLVVVGKFNCTGVIYRSDVVLTAAHCADSLEPKRKRKIVVDKNRKVEVHVGFADRTDKSQVPVKHQIGFIMRGDGSGSEELESKDPDFARFILRQPIKFNEYAQPACVLRDESQYDKLLRGGKCYSLGFGAKKIRLVPNGTAKPRRDLFFPRSAQKLQVEPVPCTISLPSDPICFGPTKRDGVDRGICVLDSGGPVLCLDENGRWNVAAINFGTVKRKGGEKHCQAGQSSRTDSGSPDLASRLSKLAKRLELGLDEGRRAIRS